MDRDSNCCVNNKGRNVPLANGEQAASKGPAAAVFFQSAEGCNPSPPQLSCSNLVGFGREHRWPRAMGPTPRKLQGEFVFCGQGSSSVPATSSLPWEALLFYLKANSISWQPFGHWNSAGNAQDKPYLFPLMPYDLSLSLSCLVVLILHLSFGALAKCWIIIKC